LVLLVLKQTGLPAASFLRRHDSLAGLPQSLHGVVANILAGVILDYAAGLAVGFCEKVEDLRENWGKDKEWRPAMEQAAVDREYALWKKAVTRTFDWAE